MTSQEAKEILLLYRPGTVDAEDPQMIEAITVARQDEDLAQWFEQHCAFQTAIRAELRTLQIPPKFKPNRMRKRQAQRARRPSILIAALAVPVCLILIIAFLLPHATRDNFGNFQSRMLATVLRDYRMDIRTNDMEAVRQFLSAHGAPGDYQVSKGLARLALTGGGALRWRNHSVAMVCFDRGDNEMLFLFVLDKSVLKEPPPATPHVGKEKGEICVRWTAGQNAYLLTGPEEVDFLQKYF